MFLSIKKSESTKSILFKLQLILLISIISARSYAGDNWKNIKMYKTTEQNIVSIYGKPDTVTINTNYTSFSKSQESGVFDFPSAYTLNYYRATGETNIMDSPLGDATEVKVLIDHNNVSAISWHYYSGDKDKAVERWINDKSFNVKETGIFLDGSKNIDKRFVLMGSCFKSIDGKSCKGNFSLVYTVGTNFFE